MHMKYSGGGGVLFLQTGPLLPTTSNSSDPNRIP